MVQIRRCLLKLFRIFEWQEQLLRGVYGATLPLLSLCLQLEESPLAALLACDASDKGGISLPHPGVPPLYVSMLTLALTLGQK